ncbi:DSD1 family PLP-dependent enzyme [Polyangium spumosum]|uniref:DSD1 family PLP-dependent enzyme n=1 Tax=Polyangium spumosum TaxID=889282 RepID=A0A6N7Q0H2_9BACT|nr:DSD1 family PLP-dependent enzyme [Polyangium spumosum]MRG95784.1 DSD1 family PLP-dependent enzyme [Polyangium spumosum]
MLEWTRGQSIGEIDTPALILDIAAAERNIRAMADRLIHGSVRLRPHVKTHKCPILAHKQMAAGAIGVTAAKLGEAEVMIRAGIPEVLVSTPIVGRTKIERLVALSRHGMVLTVVDDASAARAISDAAARAGQKIPTLVDVDVGQRRTGVLPGEPALALARQVASMPGLVFVGLQGYEGHLQHVQSRDERELRFRASMQRLTDTAALLRGAGLSVDIVSTGGTGTSTFALDATGVTEIQPGSYVVMDDHYGTVQGVGFEQALFVLTSVVSRTRTTDVIVDAGLKALSSDSGAPRVRGVEGARYSFAGDEHGRLELGDAGSDLRVGDKVLLVPSHCDTTIHLHDHFYVVEADKLIEVWPIEARGRVR